MVRGAAACAHGRAASRARVARGARTARVRTGDSGATRRRIGDCRGVGQAVLLEAEVGEEDDDMAARGVGPWGRRTTARSGRARGLVRREVGGAQERRARGRGPAMADDGARGEELERGQRRAMGQRSSGGASSCGGGRRRSRTTTAASRRRWEQGTAAAKGADQELTVLGEGGGRREIYWGGLLSRVKPRPGTKGPFVPGRGSTRDKRGPFSLIPAKYYVYFCFFNSLLK